MPGLRFAAAGAGVALALGAETFRKVLPLEQYLQDLSPKCHQMKSNKYFLIHNKFSTFNTQPLPYLVDIPWKLSGVCGNL